MEKNNEILPVNLDKNIAQHTTDLRLNDQDDFTKSLVGSLLVYFCFSSQSDLFGYKYLDPYDFAKKLGVSQKRLFEKHLKPQYIVDNYKGKFLWNSYLENALYILYTRILLTEFITKDKNNNEIVKLENFRILSKIEIHEKETKAKGTKKKLYYYSLAPEFEQNITNFFVRSSINTYVECRRKNIGNFYLFCLNNYNSNKNNGLEYNYLHLDLEFLVRMFEISKDLEPRKKKERINKYISYCKELIKDIPNINFEWVKGENSSYAYVLKLSWNNPSREILNIETYNILADTFYNTLRRRFFNEYSKEQESNTFDESHFWRWLWNLNKDNEQRVKNIFLDILYQIYNTKNEKFFILANQFSKKISKVKKIEDFKIVFSDKNFE